MTLRPTKSAGGLLLALLLLAGNAGAQSTPLPDGSFLRYGCGDIMIRGGATMNLASKSYPGMMFVPDSGWTGDLFLARHDFEKGWATRANDHEYNSFCYTAVGTGLADPIPRGHDDLPLLSEKNIEAVHQLAMSCAPDFLIGHGLGAAVALKARSMDAVVADVLVMIDPLSPQDVGTKPELSYAELIERGQNLRDHLWVEWGVGPEPGVEYPDSEIGAEGFERLLERYERDQPPYWISAETGFDGGLVMGSGGVLKGLGVLIVGTPGRSREQRSSERELADWLEDRGVRVETFELADLDLPGLSRLPMAGDHADAVFDAIFERAQPLFTAGTN